MAPEACGRKGQYTLKRARTKYNVADLGTKHVDATTLNRIIDKLGYVKVDGRSSLALRASLSMLERVTQRATDKK